MAQQYGTVKCDVITFTSGTTGNETDVSITVSGLANIEESGITITGDIQGRNITATGDLNVSGLSTTSGLTVNNAISGNTINTSGNIVTTANITGNTLTATGDLNVSGTGLIVSGLTIGGGLTVSGTGSTYSSGLTVNGTFTAGTVVTSGNATVTGDLTVTGTISGDVLKGGTLVSGGTAVFTTVTGTTVTGTTANFASGVFTTQISGATVTGDTGNFTTVTATTTNITSGIFASGTAAAPSVSVGTADNGIYSPGTDEVAVATNGSQRLLIQDTGLTVNGTTTLNGTTLSLGAEGGANGFVNAPESIYFNIDSNNSETGKTFVFAHNATDQTGTELFRIQDDGKVGIGTSSPDTPLAIQSANGNFTATYNDFSGVSLFISNDGTGGDGNLSGGIAFDSPDRSTSKHAAIVPVQTGSDLNQVGLSFWVHPSSTRQSNVEEALRIDNEGRVGIGTTSPARSLHIAGGTNSLVIERTDATTSALLAVAESNNTGIYSRAANSSTTARDLVVYMGSTEALRIDTSRRLLVGTSSYIGTGGGGKMQLVQNDGSDTRTLSLKNSATDQQLHLGLLSSGTSYITWGGYYDSGWTADDAGNTLCLGAVQFTSTSSGSTFTVRTTNTPANSPSDRLTVNAAGDVLVYKTAVSNTTEGVAFTKGEINSTITDAGGRNQNIFLNRQDSDGTLVLFRQANVTEGSITVSGSAVSYNGAHLSRWSQLPGGVERTEILRGTVLSNLDEMCEWGDEDNEQLNRMKVSDVEGDRNVAGVFQAWDDDDDTYTNDFYCAMTGDFVIRIAQGTTVTRGDLLMSAGDGTAKPQDDDIVRSKTIAKVTSTTVSATYSDGSYCVPCVLMAC